MSSVAEEDKFEDLKYFINRIGSEVLAQMFRRLIRESNNMFWEMDAVNQSSYDKGWIAEGNNYLHDLCEIIDPNLTKNLTGKEM